jgi:hypothetical protein
MQEITHPFHGLLRRPARPSTKAAPFLPDDRQDPASLPSLSVGASEDTDLAPRRAAIHAGPAGCWSRRTGLRPSRLS